MAKKLMINCASCDTRKVREETLAAYENVVINAAVVFTSAESRLLLDKYHVTMNCAQVVDVEGDVRVATINGKSQIKSTDVPEKPMFLVVNGALEIGPGTERVLEKYVGILVNGSILYPESLSGALGMMTVNGAASCYPDGAVVLKNSAVIDRTFALRAKNTLYWAKKRLILVDPQLDPAALAAKGAAFSAREAIVAESKVEALVPLIEEKTDIVIVPDGTAVILDDVVLEPVTVRRYGTKLYIVGDLKVTEDSRDALSQLEYLSVRGDALVTAAMKPLLLLKLQEISGDVKVPKKRAGRVISDKVSARVSAWLLEQEPDGVHVEDCASVKLDEDIPGALILERLTISDCAVVRCTPEQEAAVTAVCEDVAQIGSGSEEAGGGMLGSLLGGAKELLGCKMVNCSDYVM